MLRRLRIENLVLIREAELELGAGLNVLSGETGAGKTIFAQAIGLLLGVKGDVGAVGPAAKEAYVEAEFDVTEGFFDDAELIALAGLRPEDEPGVILARRVFADGRTRAYAWGRAIAREDLAAATERLISMSGQFEQRRLARPAYQLDVLDAFVGEEQAARRHETRNAWRALTAARRRKDEVSRDAGAEAARIEGLRDLVERTASFERGEEETLRAERERMRHAAELAAGAAAATTAIAPEDGEGAASLAAAAERALTPLVELAPELEGSATELRDLVHRLNDVGGDLHRFVASLEADPSRVEEVEERLDLLAEARRRFDAQTTDALLDRRDAAMAELSEVDTGVDPVTAASAALALAEEQFGARAVALHDARIGAIEAFAEAVAENLRGVGMGEGEFRVELRDREPSPTGHDEAVFLIRPNPGLPVGPVAETASGGELSRIALALAVVAGGETLVFDEIDAGIGGVTAHRVADTLARLAERAQVITITHLPQIANVATTHFRVEKIPGDPTHTRIEELSSDERRAELERMLGGEEFLAGDLGGAALVSEIIGTARLGKRTKDLVKRLKPGDLAIIDHVDLDRVSAEELVESGVRAVVNVAHSNSGRFPNPGPLELVRGGVRLVDTPGSDLFEQLSDGETVTVYAGSVWRNGTRLAEGVELSERTLAAALAGQQERVTEALEAFADNTLRHLRDEGRLLADGIDFPPLATRFRDRHAVVVARGPGYKSDLRIVRPYIRNFKPVLVAVDGGADALLEIGLRPDVIVGDFDSATDAALASGAELLVHAYADGRAPGSERLRSMGLPFYTVAAPGISEDIALLLAHERGAELIVAVGTHFNLVEFLERNREGMASTFVTRLKVGESLVDAKGVSRLVSPRIGVWPLVTFVTAGLAAIAVAVLVSPALRNVVESLGRSMGNALGL